MEMYLEENSESIWGYLEYLFGIGCHPALECKMQYNQEGILEHAWKHPMKCTWHLDFRSIVCCIIYSTKHT